jgi:hypothetical protein
MGECLCTVEYAGGLCDDVALYVLNVHSGRICNGLGSLCCTTDHHPRNKMRNNSDVGDIQNPRDPYAHLSHHRNAVYSGQISTGPSDSNSEQLRVRTAHRAFLRDTTIRSHIVVWESIAMPIHIRRVYQARVMLSNNKPLASHLNTNQHQRHPTHIRHRILVILPRRNPIRILISNQQRAAVECRRQARDHSIHLGVGARGKGARRAAENVARGGFGEGDDAGAGAVGVGEEAVFDAAGDVAEGGLRVDY